MVVKKICRYAVKFEYVLQYSSVNPKIHLVYYFISRTDFNNVCLPRFRPFGFKSWPAQGSQKSPFLTVSVIFYLPETRPITTLHTGKRRNKEKRGEKTFGTALRGLCRTRPRQCKTFIKHTNWEIWMETEANTSRCVFFCIAFSKIYRHL